MSTYSVTSTPIQVVPNGTRTTLSLVNQGPSTIYLESNSSVSTLNSHALPPMGQMTWDSGQPLWAMCVSGAVATLLVSDAAGRVDANRSHFFSLLSSNNYQQNVFYDIPIVETAHCSTLLVQLTSTQAATTAPGWYSWVVKWYDSQQNLLSVDILETYNLFSAIAGPTTGLILCRIPVVGSYASFHLVPQTDGTGTIPVLQTAKVFGTDRSFPYAYWCSNADLSAGMITGFLTGVGAQGSAGDNLQIDLSSNFAATIYLCNLSQTVYTTYFTTNITTAGSRRLRHGGPDTTHMYSEQSLATTTTGVILEKQAIVPGKSLVENVNAFGLAGASLVFNITWLGYVPS